MWRWESNSRAGAIDIMNSTQSMTAKRPDLAIVSLLIILQFSCNHTEKEAKPVSPEAPVIENKGVKIAYTDSGMGDTVLLFVHGWCINKTYWSEQVAHFSNKYRVVTLDLPGFGQSGKNRTIWTTEAYGSDVDTLMSKLDLHHVILIGHSMAGDIVLQAAVHAPGRIIGIVGIDNFKGFGSLETKQDKDEYAKVIEILRHHFKQTAFQYMNESLFSKTTADSIKRRVLNDVANSDSVIAVDCMERSDFNEVKTLKALNMKLFLINSDVTPTDSTGFVKNNISYRILSVHGTGHYPMVEDPNSVDSLLERVMAEVKSPL